MADEEVLQAMRAEWNQRAQEDASYYVAFGRRNQCDDEFFASAADVLRALRTELKRRSMAHWSAGSALEIGCGPGRLMRPLSASFAEIHGLDVSDEMIRRAQVNLKGVSNAHLHHTENSDLSQFGGESFDFVYSYAVFQHIPSKEVVLGYLAEAVRVMKPGGLFVFQISGLPDRGHEKSTWNGVRVSAAEVIEFASRTGMRLLALNDRGTQYMWVTLQKPDGLIVGTHTEMARVRKVTNTYSGDSLIPSSGRFGAASIWMDGLPEPCDLLHLAVRVDGRLGDACYVSPSVNGLRFVNVLLPRETRTGMVPIQIDWHGRPLCDLAWARVTQGAPRVPRITSITDGINLLSVGRVESGIVKMVMEEVHEPEALEVRISGQRTPYDSFCVNPLHERFEFNFPLPKGIAAGPHLIEIKLPGKTFAPITIDVV